MMLRVSKNLFIYLFLILPIISEILIAIFKDLYGNVRIGILIKGIAFCFFLLHKLKKKSIRLINLILFILIIIIYTIINTNTGYFFNEISNLVKLFFTPAAILYIHENIKDKKTCIKLLMVYACILTFSNLFYNLFGYSKKTYEYSFGFSGMFESTNDMIVATVITLYALFYSLRFKFKKNSLIFLIVCCTALLISTGSRTSIVFSIFIPLFYYFPKKNPFSFNSIKRIFFLLSIIIIFGSYIFSYVSDFMSNNIYLADKFMSLISSSDSNYNSPRRLSFDTAIKLFKSDPQNLLFGFGHNNFRTQLAKGSGLNGIYFESGKHSELDLIDVLGFYGLLVLIYLIFIYNKIYNKILLTKESKLLFLIIIFSSTISGHVLFNPLIYLPFSLIFIIQSKYD